MSNKKNGFGLNKDDEIICPWCSTRSSVEEWDENTMAQCKNRDMRREYKSLEKNGRQLMRIRSKYYYKCPACGQWANADKLRIDTDDTELSKLGGNKLYTMAKSEGLSEGTVN